ncbi:MAG: hypothetical protein Kow0090_11070 [Myxococcota bacterium]
MVEQQKDISSLEAQFDKSPDSLVFIPLGEAYLKAGRYVEAMVVCKKGLKAHPENLDAQILISEIYLAQGKVPRAKKNLEKPIEEHPDNARLVAAFAKILLSEGNEQDAIEYYKKALALDGSLAEAREFLASRGVGLADSPSPSQSVKEEKEPLSTPKESIEEEKPFEEEDAEEIHFERETTNVTSKEAVSREVKRTSRESELEPTSEEPPPPPVEELHEADFEEEREASEESAPALSEDFLFSQAEEEKPKEAKSLPTKRAAEVSAPKTKQKRSPRPSIADSALLRPVADTAALQEKAKKRMILFLSILLGLAVVILTGLYFYRVRTDSIAAAQKGIIESLTTGSFLGYQNALKQAENLIGIEADNPFGNSALFFASAALYARFGAGDEFKNKAKAILDKSASIKGLEQEALFYAGKGMYFIGLDDLTAAQASLEEGMLGKNLNNIHLVNTMILCQILKGDAAMAESYLKKARAMESTNIDAMFFEGYHKFQQGKYEEGKFSFDNIMKVHAGLAKKLERITLGAGSGAGSALGAGEGGDEEGRKDDVPKIYKEAMPPQGAYYLPEAQLYRALVLVNMGGEQYKAARMQLDEIKAHDKAALAPKTEALLDFVEGLVQIGEGKAAAGEALIAKARSKDPKNGMFVEFIAQKLLREKDYKKAAEGFENAIKLNPGRGDSYVSLAEAYLALKEYEKADLNARKGGKMMSDKIPSLLMLARIYLAQDKLDEAEKEALKVEALKERHPQALLLKARIYRKKKDAAKAEEYFLEAFKELRNRRQKREASNCAIELAKLRFDNRNKAAALEAADTAIKVDKDNADAHYFMAKLLLGEGEKKRAKEHLSEYLRLAPDGKFAERAKKVAEKL